MRKILYQLDIHCLLQCVLRSSMRVISYNCNDDHSGWRSSHGAVDASLCLPKHNKGAYSKTSDTQRPCVLCGRSQGVASIAQNNKQKSEFDVAWHPINCRTYPQVLFEDLQRLKVGEVFKTT